MTATINAGGYYDISVSKAHIAETDTNGEYLTATYATKTDLASASNALSNEYKDSIKNLSEKIDKKIYIEDKISSKISGYSDL